MFLQDIALYKSNSISGCRTAAKRDTHVALQWNAEQKGINLVADML